MIDKKYTTKLILVDIVYCPLNKFQNLLSEYSFIAWALDAWLLPISETFTRGTLTISVIGLGTIASSLKNFSIFCCTNDSVWGSCIFTCWLIVASSISAGLRFDISSIDHLNLSSVLGVDTVKTEGLWEKL